MINTINTTTYLVDLFYRFRKLQQIFLALSYRLVIIFHCHYRILYIVSKLSLRHPSQNKFLPSPVHFNFINTSQINISNTDTSIRIQHKFWILTSSYLFTHFTAMSFCSELNGYSWSFKYLSQTPYILFWNHKQKHCYRILFITLYFVNIVCWRMNKLLSLFILLFYRIQI